MSAKAYCEFNLVTELIFDKIFIKLSQQTEVFNFFEGILSVFLLVKGQMSNSSMFCVALLKSIVFLSCWFQ